MDNIGRMYEILNTFTGEAQNAALAKCQELGFDINRGIISLDESFINLNSARDLLKDAIEKRKLIQLPLTVQNILLADLEAISRQQTGLISGTDEVVNLVNTIEHLYTALWQYGLHNLSEEILGYKTKMNQLKNMEVEAINLKKELAAGVRVKGSLEKILKTAETNLDTIQNTVNSANESSQKVSENLATTTDMSQKSTGLLAVIQQSESAVAQHLASAKTSAAEVSALEDKIGEFFSQIDEYRTKINTTTDEAKKTVQSNMTETEALIAKLKELENQIKVQIQKATGFSLFHSFQTRQEKLATTKRYWAIALSLLVAASIGLTIYIFNSTDNISTAFFIKLSMSLPLIYAIAFCNVQYSRERKLEEEYAFKSNISISLIPYQELIEKRVSADDREERERYAIFMIESISKVFTSPTDKVFDHGEKQKGLNQKTMKQLFEMLEPIIKGLKH